MGIFVGETKKTKTKRVYNFRLFFRCLWLKPWLKAFPSPRCPRRPFEDRAPCPLFLGRDGRKWLGGDGGCRPHDGKRRRFLFFACAFCCRCDGGRCCGLTCVARVLSSCNRFFNEWCLGCGERASPLFQKGFQVDGA